MKKSIWISVGKAFVVAMVAVLSGCGDDRPVYVHDGVVDAGGTAGSAGTGGSGGTTSTGGNAGTGGTAGTGGSSTGGNAGKGGSSGTGGNAGNVPSPGSGIDYILTKTVKANEAYNTPGFWSDMRDGAKECMNDDDCWAAAWYDSPGREYQFVATGKYDEICPGQMKAACRWYHNPTCGAKFTYQAGVGCTDSNGYSRACTVFVAFGFSASNKPLQGTAFGNFVTIGAETGDECEPFVDCGGYEHAIHIGRDGSTPMSGTVSNGHTLEVSSMAEKMEVEAALANTPAFERPVVVLRPTTLAVTINPTYKGLPK